MQTCGLANRNRNTTNASPETTAPRSARILAAARAAVGDLDTALTACILATFVLLQWGARSITNLPESAVHAAFLLVKVPQSNPVAALALLVSVGAIAVLGRLTDRPFIRWDSFDHGRRLQIVTAVLLVLASWRHVGAARNFYFDQWFAADRVMLVALVALTIWRPLFAPLWVVYLRLMQQPFLVTPFVLSGLEIDEMAVKMVTVIGATVLVMFFSNTKRSAGGLAVMVAALASDFFLPGRVKLRFGWLQNDLGNVPLNGYAQGWLGSGDGGLAHNLARWMGAVELPLVILTLAFELAALFLLFHRKVLIGWLLVAIGFHISVLATYGFVFAEFVVVELAILALVVGQSGSQWSRRAFALGPRMVALVAVLLGPQVFHSPVLVWFDGPLVYGYEIRGIDTDGNEWALEAEHFAPYDDVISFGNIGLANETPLVGPYGAVGIGEREKIASITSLAEVTGQEEGRTSHGREERVELLNRFLVSTQCNDASCERSSLRQKLGTPRHFITSRPGPDYSFEAPLVKLEVAQVTRLWHGDRTSSTRRTDIVEITMDEGAPVVAWLN